MGGEFGDEDERKITRLENNSTTTNTGGLSNNTSKVPSGANGNNNPAINNSLIPPPSPLQGSNSNPIMNNLNGSRVSKMMNGPGSPATSIASQLPNLNSNKVIDLPTPINSSSMQQSSTTAPNSAASSASLNNAPLVNGNFPHPQNSSPHPPINGVPVMPSANVKSEPIQIKSEPMMNNSTPSPAGPETVGNVPPGGPRFQGMLPPPHGAMNSIGNPSNHAELNNLSANDAVVFNNNLMPNSAMVVKQERKPQQTPSPLSNPNPSLGGPTSAPNQPGVPPNLNAPSLPPTAGNGGGCGTGPMGQPTGPPNMNSADAHFMPNQMPPHSTNMPPNEFNHSFPDMKVRCSKLRLFIFVIF